MKISKSGFLSASLILLLGSVLFMANSCQHEGIPADQMPQVCFTEEVLPIFMNSCATSGCHDANSSEGDYNFSNYTSIMEAITPGNANKSKAYKAITSTTELMPPGNALPMNKRIIIRQWIEQGAKETTCNTSFNTQP